MLLAWKDKPLSVILKDHLHKKIIDGPSQNVFSHKTWLSFWAISDRIKKSSPSRVNGKRSVAIFSTPSQHIPTCRWHTAIHDSFEIESLLYLFFHGFHRHSQVSGKKKKKKSPWFEGSLPCQWITSLRCFRIQPFWNSHSAEAVNGRENPAKWKASFACERGTARKSSSLKTQPTLWLWPCLHFVPESAFHCDALRRDCLCTASSIRFPSLRATIQVSLGEVLWCTASPHSCRRLISGEKWPRSLAVMSFGKRQRSKVKTQRGFFDSFTRQDTANCRRVNFDYIHNPERLNYSLPRWGNWKLWTWLTLCRHNVCLFFLGGAYRFT